VYERSEIELPRVEKLVILKLEPILNSPRTEMLDPPEVHLSTEKLSPSATRERIEQLEPMQANRMQLNSPPSLQAERTDIVLPIETSSRIDIEDEEIIFPTSDIEDPRRA
jgi:hypothetical protein